MRKVSPELQAQLDKYAAMPTKAQGKTCKQLAEGAQAKLAKAAELRKTNTAKAKAAMDKAKAKVEAALKKHEAEIKREAAAVGAELTCKLPKVRKPKALPKRAVKAAEEKIDEQVDTAIKKRKAKKAGKKAGKKKATKKVGKKAAKKTSAKKVLHGWRALAQQFGGVEFDRKMLNSANRSTGGQGDGRISIKDAHRLLKHIEDGHKYTSTEKATMAFIRDNWKFTPEADEWFRHQIASDAAVKAAKTRAKGAAKKASAKKTAKKAGEKKAAKKSAGKRAAKAATAGVDITLQATVPAAPATRKKRAKKAAKVEVSSQGADAETDKLLLQQFANAINQIEGGAANEALPRRSKRDGRKKAGRRPITEACPTPNMGY